MAKQPEKFTLADVFQSNIWDLYYDGMDAIREKRNADAEACFKEILRLNPEFPGGYEGLVYVEVNKNKVRAQRKYAALAFKKVLQLYPSWPSRLPWGVMDNRPILRIILLKAMYHHKDDEAAEAEQWYRLLLKLNPGDNQGVRFMLDRLRRGLSPTDESDD